MKPCRKCGAADRDPLNACRPCKRSRYLKNKARPGRKCACGNPVYKLTTECRACDFQDRIKRQYRTDVETIARAFEAQGRRCKLCLACLDLGKNSHIDHCHRLGEFRGWLCGSCNRGLGYFQDDPSILLKAARYVLEAADV